MVSDFDLPQPDHIAGSADTLAVHGTERERRATARGTSKPRTCRSAKIICRRLPRGLKPLVQISTLTAGDVDQTEKSAAIENVPFSTKDAPEWLQHLRRRRSTSLCHSNTPTTVL
eukprot:GHVT01101252.1.p1 GENE.GHVT01101252.1~~GHVT01101252.1.p1  ORF type:complete len:115 (+),score=13.55 GHVT01101252.1:439-783(+)